MGFPVIESIYGSDSLIYAVIFVVIFNILIYSLGIYLVAGKTKNAKFDIKKLINTPFIVSLISIIMYFTKIQLSREVLDSLTFLGNVTTPVAMMIIGATIANMPVKKLFNEWRIYVFTVVKLIAILLVVLLILNQFTFISATLKGCLVVLSAMPVATNMTMLAIEYDGNVGLTSKGIFFTTILCAVTIPFVETLV